MPVNRANAAAATEIGNAYAWGLLNGLWTTPHGAPNNWAVDGNGRFTPMFDSEAFKAAAAYFYGPGDFGITVLKKTTPERAKVLLRVLDFLAAPFGSQEYESLVYGVRGTDFNYDDQGNPRYTDKGLFAPSLGHKGVAALQTLGDGLSDIVTGRRAFSEFDQLVKDWHSNGGDQLKTEYEQAYAASK